MLRNGAWRVELTVPIRLNSGKVLDEITINPPNFDHVDKWNQGVIASNLGLLAELCGVSESVLRSMTFPDADRVMLALVGVLPLSIRQDVVANTRPTTTPLPEDAPTGLRFADDPTADPFDPRFPRGDGSPVERFADRPPGLGVTSEDTVPTADIGIGPLGEITKPAA